MSTLCRPIDGSTEGIKPPEASANDFGKEKRPETFRAIQGGSVMLLYATLGSNDLLRARKFYDAALAPLGIVCSVANDEELGYGSRVLAAGERQRFLYIVDPLLRLPATWGNGTMLALQGSTRKIVDEFYAAALANGGIDEGAPGLRPYHASFYACYVRDPDGNKLSVVCESES